MDAEQKRMFDALRRCTFQPGSFDKRFVRDVSSQTTDLTPRQEWFLRRTYWRYRRQIGHDEPKPADFDNPPTKTEKPVTVPKDVFVCGPGPSADLATARELERLKAWNEGKPRKVSP